MAIFKSTKALSEELETQKVALESLEVSFAKLEEENLALKETIKTHEETLAVTANEKTELAEANEKLKLEIEKVVAEKVELDDAVAKKTSEKLAETGADPVEEIDEEEQPKTVLETFMALSGDERTEFFNAHKSEIITQL